MNISEWCKLKRDNVELSEEAFAVKAWNLQKQQIKDTIMQLEQERFEKAAEKQIERQIDNNLERVIDKAIKSNKSTLNIKINL